MESLLKDECYECYICMEPCKTKSPCLCETNVHGKCLEQYIALTNQEICTICLDTYPIIRHSPRKRPCNLVGAGVASILVFTLSNVLGHFIISPRRTYDPLAFDNMLFALVGSLVILVCAASCFHRKH